MKKVIFLGIILVLGILRFLYIDWIPVGLSNDEIEYMVSAKSYSLYGKDVSGFGFPLSLIKTQTDGIISPIPAMVLSLPLKFLPLNQSIVRSLYVIVNLLTAFCLYLISNHIFPKKRPGIIVSILFLTSPWSIYFSRHLVDTPFALLFYLAGILLLLRNKGWKLIYAFIFFGMAFFSYHGGKFIFLPIILCTFIFKAAIANENILKIKGYWISMLFSLLFMFTFLLVNSIIPDSATNTRRGDIIFNNKPLLEQTVNTARQQSIQNPFTNLLSNKGSVIFKTFTKQYLTAFSPEVLFVGGDLRATYRFNQFGLLFLFDLILVPLGIITMYSKNRKVFFYLLTLMIAAPLATAVSTIEISVINRSFLLLPILTIFSAYGLIEVIEIPKTRIVKYIAILIATLAIMISILSFYVFYFFRFPITAQENYWLSESLIDKYSSFIQTDQQVVLITDRPRSTYLRYIFFSDKKVQSAHLVSPVPFSGNSPEYVIGNIVFTNRCPKKIDNKIIYVISSKIGCSIEQKPDFVITDQKDAGRLFAIYNSSICKGVSGEKWRRFNQMSYYKFWDMNYEDFCKKWIFIP